MAMKIDKNELTAELSGLALFGEHGRFLKAPAYLMLGRHLIVICLAFLIPFDMHHRSCARVVTDATLDYQVAVAAVQGALPKDLAP
jgi:hypothetical protein